MTEVAVPSSNSSVRGLARDVQVEVRPDESCEHMMRRIDRDQVAAVCEHLVGTVEVEARRRVHA